MQSVLTRCPPLTALFALGGLLLGSSLASAAASRIVRPVTDAPAPAATASTPTSAQGSRAIPVTPGMNPMRETAPGVYEGIVPFRLPDGSWQVHLDERFHAFTVARSTGFGFLGTCVHGATGLARWRAATVPGEAACSHAPAARASGGIRPSVTAPSGTTVTKWEDR